MDIKPKISSFVSSQIPAFISDEYGVFIEFVKSYYDFMSQENMPQNIFNQMYDSFDVDVASQVFLENIQKEIAQLLPKNFTVKKDLVLKHLPDLYLSKGSPTSIALLFKILYGSDDVQIFYPKTQLLIPSDGIWIERKIIRCTEFIGNPFELVGKVIRGGDQSVASVDDVTLHYEQNLKIYTLLLTQNSVVGKFESSDVVEDVLGEVAVQTLDSPSAIVALPGYFDKRQGNKGELSDINKLQDGEFYQTFSYVIKSEISTELWKSAVEKLLHPAGMKVFGEISIKSYVNPYLNRDFPDYQNTYASVGIVGQLALEFEESFATNSEALLFTQTYCAQSPSIYFGDDYCAAEVRNANDNIPVNDVTNVIFTDATTPTYI